MNNFDHLLYLIKLQGAEKALQSVDIEAIDDITIKVIARTIMTGCERLQEELVDRIAERDAPKSAS